MVESRWQSHNSVPAATFWQRLTTFASWGALVGVSFFSIYPTTNWFAGLRDPRCLFFAWELSLPLVPQFIWFYLSMYILFALPPFFLSPGELKLLAKELIAATCLAGVVFFVLPARLGFPRVVPPDWPYREMFQTLFAIDQPFNLVPSLHVVYSTAIVLAIAGQLGKRRRAALFVWLGLLCVSTILVHQHHLLDVATGLALAFGLHSYWKRRIHRGY